MDSAVQAQSSQGVGRPGVKDDGGKLRWDLLPWRAVEGVIKVMTFGAKKYSPNGWRTVPEAKARYEAASLRHRAAMKKGEVIDPETGLPHQFHIACNEVFLAEFVAEELNK